MESPPNLFFQITSLREELERSNLSRQQQVEKVAALDKLLKESEDKIQLKAALANETCSEEMAQLISDLDALQADKVHRLTSIYH